MYSIRRPRNDATKSILEPTWTGGGVCHRTDSMLTYHDGALPGSPANAATHHAAHAAEGRDPATLERTVGIEIRDPTLGAAEPGDEGEGEDRAFGGSVDELAEAIAAYDELGIGHLIVVLQPMNEASLERLALALARR